MGKPTYRKYDQRRREALVSAHRTGAGAHGRSGKAERRRQRQQDQRALREKGEDQ